jgi:flagellar biosynthesis/type III secretory pathway protein FliH
LLVVTVNEAVARWAARSIDLGGGNRFIPLVLGPSGVPVVTDEEMARQDPELAVLSAMAHGKDADVERTVRIAAAAMVASVGLDVERSTLYFDLVEASLSEAARKALRSMDPAKYEYQSEFARHYFAQGRAEGEAEGEAKGRAEVVAKQLSLRFGTLPDSAQRRLRNASIAELDRIAERLLTAASLDEALE